MTTPKTYTVISAPYGETITTEFDSLDDASDYMQVIAALTGQYQTSWGLVTVDNYATLITE